MESKATFKPYLQLAVWVKVIKKKLYMHAKTRREIDSAEKTLK